ncbi:hypothetical protein C8R44DRAFT_753949 [Mycena epipterygia]|nr:hypothetical protein C8R44DRAFT_753949 [Mycena epipterygia]
MPWNRQEYFILLIVNAAKKNPRRDCRVEGHPHTIDEHKPDFEYIAEAGDGYKMCASRTLNSRILHVLPPAYCAAYDDARAQIQDHSSPAYEAARLLAHPRAMLHDTPVRVEMEIQHTGESTPRLRAPSKEGRWLRVPYAPQISWECDEEDVLTLSCTRDGFAYPLRGSTVRPKTGFFDRVYNP